jgi:hypothetical protein
MYMIQEEGARAVSCTGGEGDRRNDAHSPFIASNCAYFTGTTVYTRRYRAHPEQ